MKKTIIIATVIMATGCKLTAQTSATVVNNKFVSAMEANLKILDTASAPETYILLANNFERIGNAEQKQWQPFYFASFCYGVMASNVPDKTKVDPLLDKAESYLGLADALDKNNSEISTLRGMILYTRLSVDPMSRWRLMGSEANDQLAKAKDQDPANPRPYFIEANAKLRMPEGLGGGPKAAKVSIDICLEKFKTFVPVNTIAPNWGKAQAEKLLKLINL
jgi:hypothetical protein